MNYKKELGKFIARDPFFNYRSSDKFETIAYLRGNLAQAKSKSLEGLRKTARTFLRENAGLFGKDSFEKLEISLEAKDPNGGADIVYQQYHGKSLVYSGGIRFHFNKKGILDTVSSRLNPTLASVPLKPKLTTEEAAKKAVRKLRPARLVEVVRTLCYYYKGKTYLVWEVHLRGLEPGDRGTLPFWIVYVDAVTGRVVDYYDNIQTAIATGIGRGYYSNNSNPQYIKVWDTGSAHQLRDSTRTGGPQIVTYDAPENKVSEDADSDWNNLSASPRNDNQGAEIDVHVYAGEVADYLKVHFGRNSYDGQGGDMAADVHQQLDPNPQTSFWLGSRAYFGDGSALAGSKFDYLCSKDVVAHEFGHGVTNTATQELQYSYGESGALHESFSDFMAALITQNWLIGEECWLPARLANPPAPALRNMIDPTNGGLFDSNYPTSSALNGRQPAHFSQYVSGADPHINSGIINQFFYLLCAGGTNPVSGIHVNGIGEAVVETIFYRALTVNMFHNNTADFLDFRKAMIDACLDLYPPFLTEIKKAFKAVGIGPDMVIRDNLGDTGEEPKSDSLWDSPDIMNFYWPASAAIFADLYSYTTYPLEAGQTNYVYVRLQNLGWAGASPEINAAAPQVSLYIAPASSFSTHSTWTHLGTTDPVSPDPWFAPGMVVALDIVIPQGLIPPVGNYCLIAVVTDSLDPTPDFSQLYTITDYINYFSGTNNVAVRSMDVVDYQPNVFKWHEFTIGHMGSVAVNYHVSFDLEQFVPGATFYVRGPRKILAGANVRGLKLIERDRNDNIYEALTGDELIKQQKFTPARKDIKSPVTYGFEDLRTDKAFNVEIGYKMPSEEVFRKLGQPRLKEGFEFSMRQFHEDKLLGRVGLKFRQDDSKRLRRKRKKPPRPAQRQSGMR